MYLGVAAFPSCFHYTHSANIQLVAGVRGFKLLQLEVPFFPKEIFSSVQFSRSVGSDSLRPRELQYNRPPCPSPTPEVHPNSCPLSR